MTRKVVFRTARGSRAQPLIETLDRRLLLAAAPTSTVIYAVQATASAADSVRTFAGSVTLPLAGGSSAFDSGGAHISVSVAKSVVTVSGTGFAQEEGFTITGTAGGSGPLVLSADGDTYGGSGPIAGTARSVDNEDGTVY